MHLGYLIGFFLMTKHLVKEERLCLKRYNHKGIKVSIRPLDEPRLKTQAQELQTLLLRSLLFGNILLSKLCSANCICGFVGRSQLFIFTLC